MTFVPINALIPTQLELSYWLFNGKNAIRT